MAIQTRTVATAKPKPRASIALFSGLSSQDRINASDRRFFTEQLALLLETGSSMQASLQAIRAQVTRPVMIALIDQLLDDVQQGRQLSAALSRHPDTFSQTYVNLIAASEEGGYLHEVLEQLLEMEYKREELRQTMVSALSYPVFLLVFALAVIIFVLLVVFPKFEDLFTLIADQLPVTTVLLMATSNLIADHWMSLSAGLIILVAAVRYWSASSSGRYRIDHAKLHLPLLRTIFTQLYLVQSMRVLSLSLGNGVSILQALHSIRDVVDNRLFQRFVHRVEDHVERGEGVAAGFQETPFIPPVVAQMIKTGEETGNLPRVLRRLAGYYESELTKRLQTLSRLAEPVMLLVMGGVVGLIVSSLILPIFKLSRAVG